MFTRRCCGRRGRTRVCSAAVGKPPTARAMPVALGGSSLKLAEVSKAMVRREPGGDGRRILDHGIWKMGKSNIEYRMLNIQYRGWKGGEFVWILGRRRGGWVVVGGYGAWVFSALH